MRERSGRTAHREVGRRREPPPPSCLSLFAYVLEENRELNHLKTKYEEKSRRSVFFLSLVREEERKWELSEKVLRAREFKKPGDSPTIVVAWMDETRARFVYSFYWLAARTSAYVSRELLKKFHFGWWKTTTRLASSSSSSNVRFLFNFQGQWKTQECGCTFLCSVCRVRER